MKSSTIIVLVVLIVFGIIALSWIPYGLFKDEVSAKVLKTERITQTNGNTVSSKYLVYTDKETFENTDCLWALKFRSSDLYGKIQKDSTYTFKVYGWRIPLFSMYRNILTATPK